MRLSAAFLLISFAVICQNYFVSGTICNFPNTATCDPDMKMHALNGTCNNEGSPAVGSLMTPFSRYISHLPTGGTGNIPFKSFFGYPLPDPRDVSLQVFPCHDGLECSTTHLFAIFGKLIIKDLFCIRTEEVAATCCPSCLGIKPQISDPRNCGLCIDYYKPFLSTDILCTGGIHEGINTCTGVIDASFLFGNEWIQEQIGSGDGHIDTTSGFVPASGTDDNIKENPLMVALYHVFVRAYNHILYKLLELDVPNAPMEARKLLIAIWQHIIYSEFLPLLIGENIYSEFENDTLTYNDTQLPQVSHSFSLAFKLAMESMMRENVTIASIVDQLVNIMNNSQIIDSDKEMKDIVEEMLTEASLDCSNKLSCLIRHDCNHTDLVAILTQDTRVFGIPPYFVWLALTGHFNVRLIDNFPYHDDAKKAVLSGIYKNVYDIDYLSGLFTETKAPPAAVGPTLKKLFKDQFNSLKDGDRFFYANTDVFQSYQLEEIKKIQMANLLCRNVPGLTSVKENAFEMTSPDIACSTLTDIDFCKYANYAREWTPFTSSEICIFLKIKSRICLSLNPLVCNCEGDPIVVESCPGNLLTLEMQQKLYNFNKLINSYSFLRDYAQHGNTDELEKQIKMLYSMMMP